MTHTISHLDSIRSESVSVARDHGNSNDDGTVTTHSVVDGPPFDDDETFNDPSAMFIPPDLASLSPSPDDENIGKQATVALPFYPKHVRK